MNSKRSKTELPAMATKTSLCTICDLRHLTTSSTHWCPECEEALCTNCKEHHSLSKSSRCHRVISISEYNCLPPSIVNIDLFCTYHNEKYLQYCVKHECPICYKCINEHGNCGGLTLLEELARDVKSSEVFRDMEQSLKDMIVNISRIREDRKTNIQMIQDKKKKIVEEVIQFRTQINQHLDKLQDNFIKELNKTETECCEKMQSIVSPVNIQDKEIIQCNTEIEKMKKYASDIQTFLGMRNLQIKITKNEKCIESLVVDKKIEKLDLEYTIDATIRDLFTNVQKLGLITVKNYPSDSIGLVRKKDRQAQILATEHKQSGTNLKQNFSRKTRY